MKEYTTYERKIYYYETDQMKIVHHSNYIRWFEEARIDFMKQMGLPYDEIEKRGILIPVLEASCRYKKAFRYGETFMIRIRLRKFKGVKFSISYEVYNRETGELHATGSSEHGFVDRNLRPVHLKRDYPDIYECFAAAVSDENEAE